MRDYTHGPAPGFFRLWWGNNALFPILLAVSFGLLMVFEYQEAAFAADLDVQGVVVEATAVDRREISVRRYGQTERDYYVTFQYVAGGETQIVERKVPRHVYRAMTLGAVRDIRYVRASPRQMEYTVGGTRDTGQRVRWLALALGLATLGVFWWTARPAVEALRARRFGAAEWARVVRIDERVTRTKNGTTKRYVLAWQDHRGERGESLPSLSSDRYLRYPSGSEIEVYRDSRGKTWWVGDVGPRAAAPPVPDVSKPTS
ncbi:hypothetical protein [Tateyamaria omphalii]|uniref:DUF3592 domain-containing protein n=1 Tax=Tateyamaria omphalii TaxID=299262 RepID=A0A1P8MV28_9RHOB|nr:hypothetical protein [Tateyamaria omphalii]APX11946.1 hypothetical protein BWR18_09860 [Tateyamaria omphalii]